jgi:hypothetical protein
VIVSRIGAALAAGLATVVVLSARVVVPPPVYDQGEQRASRYFESIRHQPPEEWAFLKQMPKGGDLHSHFGGAIYAESMIGWAVQRGLCIQLQTYALSAPPCDPKAGQAPIASEINDARKNTYRNAIDAWSMRNWQQSGQSGHDHFFDTFDKFLPALQGHDGEMLAEVVSRAARGHVSYLELMTTPDAGGAAVLGAAAGWHGDAAAAVSALDAGGISRVVTQTASALRSTEATKDRLLHCNTPQADPGCAVTVRWLYQVLRAIPPGSVFGQLVLGFHLASDPSSLVVGLNMVQPEDSPGSMQQFAAEMQMIKALRPMFPQAHLTLHAGELAAGLVPPDGLSFHIRDSVEIAGAERIGHGVDVMHETDAIALLDEMATKRVMVEICLTSNDLILGIRGRDHPLTMYLRHGVPVALATDDEGVSRSEMTAEYLKAAEDQQLGYQDLKAMARTSLEFAFVPGASLWRDARRFIPVNDCSNGTLGQMTMPTACQTFLASSEKARLQWDLERQFSAFEKRY